MTRATTHKRPLVRLGGALCKGALIAGLLCGAVGCEAPDWTNPDFVAKQIAEGDRLRALDELRRLPDEGQKKLVPALINAYNNDQDKDKVFGILAEMRDERAKSVYVDALKNARSNRDKAKAAVALGDIKATEHIPTMVDMFQNVNNEDLRRSILSSFKSMPDAQQIPVLLEILNNFDPDREPIAYHSFACDILAAVDQPTEAVVQAVVYGVYLDNAKNQNVARECSVAVTTTGKLAVPEVGKVYKGEHEKIKKRFAKYPSYIVGSSEVTAADMLGLLRDKSAVPILAEGLTTTRSMPATYRDNQAIAWGQKRNEFFVATVDSLGKIGDPAALEAISPFVVPDDKTLEPFKVIIDYDKRMKLFMVEAAAKAVNTLGDRAGLEVLAQGITKGELKELSGYGAGAKDQSRWQSARAYAMLATGDKLEDWDKMAKAEKTKEVKEKMTEFRPALELAKECGSDAACYGKALSDKNPIKAEKAAWELGRMSRGGAAEEALLAGMDIPKPNLRSVVIDGLFRVGTDKTKTKIDAVLAKEDGRATPEFKVLHSKMQALKAFIDNNK